MATFQGNNKDNTLTGTKFKDKLFGLGGNDTLKGLAGSDRLEGGQGNDKLYGGNDKDKDTFVFAKSAGKDTIMDFDVKKDVIEIAKGLNGIKKVADIFKHADQKGKDVVVDLGGGNKITIKDVKLADLKKNADNHFDVV